jgi:hypothetical protein
MADYQCVQTGDRTRARVFLGGAACPFDILVSQQDVLTTLVLQTEPSFV